MSQKKRQRSSFIKEQKKIQKKELESLMDAFSEDAKLTKLFLEDHNAPVYH